VPGDELSDEQRQTLFRFNTVAHRAGFAYGKATGAWAIDNIGRIERFVREDLAEWRKRFKLVGEDALNIFRNEQIQVAVDAEAESAADGKSLRAALAPQGRRPSPAGGGTEALLKAGGRPGHPAGQGRRRLQRGRRRLLRRLAHQGRRGASLPAAFALRPCRRRRPQAQ
jgi:hypothetical protein